MGALSDLMKNSAAKLERNVLSALQLLAKAIDNGGGGGSITGFTTATDTALGTGAGAADTQTNHNVFVGASAGASTTGDLNVFVGYLTGRDSVSAHGNTFIGTYAGALTTTGYYNVLIGLGAQAPAPDASNFINIGDTIKGDMSNGPIEITKDLQLDTGNLIFVGATSTPGASAGTLTNAPAVGNPQTWLQVTINSVVHFIPAWHV